MMQLSLWLNIGVLIPVTATLALNRPGASFVFGERTPARGILLSIYFAILVLSAVLLWTADLRACATLLLMQVVYKLSTPVTVGSLKNPVVLSNLAISLVHIVSLWSARALLLE
jgi:hypothetical protein